MTTNSVTWARALGIEAFQATGAEEVILGLQQRGIIGEETSNEAINADR